MKKGAWKKGVAAFALVMVATMSGSAVTNWIANNKTETEDKTDNGSQASIECVMNA